MEYLYETWQSLVGWQAWAAILSLCAVLTAILGVAEKITQRNFIGRRIFHLIWTIIRFFGKWFFMPFAPQLIKLKEAAFVGYNTSHKVDILLQKGDERDVHIAEFKDTLVNITKEFRTNGGTSIKDDVNTLLESDKEKLHILHGLRNSVELNTMRINIIDDDTGRMSYRMNENLEITEISSTFLRSFGWTEDDIIGGDWDLYIAERSKTTVQSKWQKALKKKTEYSNHQYLLDSDGKEIFCKVHGYPRFLDGKFTDYYGTIEIIKEDPVTLIGGSISIIDDDKKKT